VVQGRNGGSFSGAAAERLPACVGRAQGDRLFSVVKLTLILLTLRQASPRDFLEEEKTTTLAKKDGTRKVRKEFSRRLCRAEENPDSL